MIKSAPQFNRKRENCLIDDMISRDSLYRGKQNISTPQIKRWAINKSTHDMKNDKINRRQRQRMYLRSEYKEDFSKNILKL